MSTKLKGSISDCLGYTLLDMRGLLEVLKVSRAYVYNLMKEGHEAYDPTFPRPLKIGNSRSRRVLWRSDELAKWIEGLPRSSGEGA